MNSSEKTVRRAKDMEQGWISQQARERLEAPQEVGAGREIQGALSKDLNIVVWKGGY